MSKKLRDLIELAKNYQMSPEERDAQVGSFAYGNTHFENDSITKAHIDEAMESLKVRKKNCAPRAATASSKRSM